MLGYNTTTTNTDAVVVGTGILGLMLAKRLLDFGQRVVLIDRSLTIANGASSMNHGWIHQGSAPSLTANDQDHADRIVKKLQYGHDFFKAYAPECFDEPFEHTYAVTADAKKAAHARKTWAKAGIAYKELTRAEFRKIEPNITTAKAKYFFQVPESRINNRMLFMKLYKEIRDKGAMVYLGAEYEYESDNTIRISTAHTSVRVTSPVFLYATGTQLDDTYKKFTGESLGMQYCKSHLLYVPKITNVSIIGLDHSAPIIFNHGDISIINRSYDETPSETNTDFTVNSAEIDKSLKILGEYYPLSLGLLPEDIQARAFLKPFLATTQINGRHSADQTIIEPKPGHVFALPGKMTAAPYVADQIIKQVGPMLESSQVTNRPFDRVRLVAAPSKKRELSGFFESFRPNVAGKREAEQENSAQ